VTTDPHTTVWNDKRHVHK